MGKKANHFGPNNKFQSGPPEEAAQLAHPERYEGEPLVSIRAARRGGAT